MFSCANTSVPFVQFQKVSLTLPVDTTCGVLGTDQNTTTWLLSALAGYETPSAGVLRYFGIDARGSGLDRARAHHGIGMCPPQSFMWKKLTVQQHLTIFAHLVGVPDTTSAVTQLAYTWDLVDVLPIPARRLGAADLRRVFVASAFLGDPKVVLLDQVSAVCRCAQVTRRVMVTVLRSRPAKWTPTPVSACGGSLSVSARPKS